MLPSAVLDGLSDQARSFVGWIVEFYPENACAGLASVSTRYSTLHSAKAGGMKLSPVHRVNDRQRLD